MLKIKAAPITWPIGCKDFKGVYHPGRRQDHRLRPGHGHERIETKVIEKLDSDEARAHLGDLYDNFVEELELVQGACHEFDKDAFLKGEMTPVFFGTALGNFGVDQVLDCIVDGRRSRCRAPPTNAAWSRPRRSSPASCSRSRRTWIPSTATASPSCASARASTRKA